MHDAWEVLGRGGLPLHADRSGAIPSPAEMAEAALRLIAAPELSERERESLGAWLRAWKAHWATSFDDAFAAEAPRVLDWAEDATPDANRYLKLRRIAIARLAGIL